jgi:uncharacterized protein (DUF983 family)
VPETPGPYDDLDRPEAPRPFGAGTGEPVGPEPGALRVLARGLARRCPRCGAGGLFASWLRIRDRCPRCSLPLEREEGGFLGAMTINYTVTALVWVIVLVVWLLLDLPEVHVAALLAVSLGVAGLVPLAFYPFAKTIWCAVDHLVTRAGPERGRFPTR